MSAIYPLSVHRRVERQWTERMESLRQIRYRERWAARENNLKWGRTPPAERARGRSPPRPHSAANLMAGLA
jgi:hypothetical protein